MMQQQKGLSLIELLVAMGLGLLITAAVSQVFISSRQTERLQQAMSQVQDSGRFALNLIVSDLQRTGYMGCNTPLYSIEMNMNQTTANSVDQEGFVDIIATNTGITAERFSREALAGFENAGGGTLTPTPGWAALQDYLDADDTLDQKSIANSDVISFYFGIPESNIELAEDYMGDNSPIQITNNKACLSQDDTFLITNCTKTVIARITNALSNCSDAKTALEFDATGNAASGIPDSFMTNETEFMQMSRVTYYVADTGRTDANGRTLTALYRRINNGAAEEIVEGVESLQIEYGERVAGDNVRFVTANAAGLDMGKVFSVRVGLLVRSNNDVLDSADDNTYQLPGQAISNTGAVTYANGRMLRRAFVTTVKLRNRF